MSPIDSGIVERKQLKPNAVPSIFELTDTTPTPNLNNNRAPQQQQQQQILSTSVNPSIISNYQQQMFNVLNNRSINSDIIATTSTSNHPALSQQQQQFYNNMIPNYELTNYMFNSNHHNNNSSSVGNNKNLNSNTTSNSDDYNDEYSDDDDDDEEEEDGDEGEEYENDDENNEHDTDNNNKSNEHDQQQQENQQQKHLHPATNTFPMASSISSVCPSVTSSASSTCDDNEVNHNMNTEKDEMMLNDDINNKQSTSDSQLNRSNTSSQGSAKKRGLSDVISKLTKQHSSSNCVGPQTSSQNTSPIAQNSNNNDSVSPQTAIINAVATATSTYPSISPSLVSKLEETAHHKKPRNKSTTNNTKGNKTQNRQQNQPQQQQQQQQSKTPINQASTTTTTTNSATKNNQIAINQVNKLEIDLYRLLEKANLLQYFNDFTKIGADDINQLSEEFNEIIQLVGMDSKPLHVKRLRKALDEYKNEYKIKTEYNNYDTYDGLNTNINPKFNLNSPAATTNSSTHSTYDSGIHSAASSTIYSGTNIKLEQNISDNQSHHNQEQTTQQQQQQQQQQQHYSQHHHNHNHNHTGEQRNNENHHDDTQYDSNGEMNSHDYSKFKASGSHSSESHCTTDEDDDGSLNNSDDHIDPINSSGYQNDSVCGGGGAGGNGDNSYMLKNDQNEKNAKKNLVIELYKNGEHNVRRLHNMTSVPLTTVYRVIGKLKGINYNIPRGNGAGRKTILDTADREILVQILKDNPRISRKCLGKELEKLTGKSIHNSTLNRELCRLKYHGTTGNVDRSLPTSNVQSPGTPNITSSSLNSSINTPTSSAAIMKNHSPLNAQPSRNVNNKLTIDTNLNTPKVKPNHSRSKEQQQQHQEPQIQIRPHITSTTTASTTAAPINRAQTTTNLNPSASLLTPSAMLAAAAAAFGYPHQGTTASTTHPAAHMAHLSPLFAQMQPPFGINPAAFAAYSQYFNSSGADLAAALAAFNKTTTTTTTTTTSQNINSPVNSNTFQLDNDYIKLICNETKRFCESLPKLESKPLSNMKPEIAQQIIDLVNDTTKDSGKSREDTIRQLTNYLTKFDTKRTGDKMMYDYCLNEATVQLCIQRPALLTRRDDLLNYGKQILYNLNIFENTTTINNGKRSAGANTENNNKRAKYETANQENISYMNSYSNMLYNPMVSNLNLAHLNKLQDSLRNQVDLKSKIQIDQINDKHAASSPLLYQQLNDEARKYSESLNEQSRLNLDNHLKNNTNPYYNNSNNNNNDDKSDDEPDGDDGDDDDQDSDKNMIINEQEHDTNSHSTMDENENANAIASIEMENAQLAGDNNNEHENDNDDADNDDDDDNENINVDEIDEDNNGGELMKTDSNNNRSFH